VLIIGVAPVPAITEGKGAAADATDEDAVDATAAAMIAAPGFGPDLLMPLPVAALPGWDTEDNGPGLFDDLSVFRPPVLR
jgi:hypothetical protein